MKGLLTVFAFVLVGASSAFGATESFRQSCDVVYEDRSTIEAYCADTRGNEVYNNYFRSYCSGDLANINGYITCEEGRGRRPRPNPRPDYPRYPDYPDRGGLPYGSYQQSCQDCVVRDDKLACYCADRRGRLAYTKVRYTSCRGDIANINGQLTCR